MRVIERAALIFKGIAKHGQPFVPSDSDRMIADATDAEIAALGDRIKTLASRLDKLETAGPGDVA